MVRGGLPLPLPASVPQFPRGAAREFAAWLLGRCGWRLRGEMPDLPRVVLVVAPHSSWWDGFWGLLFKVALGVEVAFMAKRELFVGPLGWLLRRLGGIPVERSAAHGLVEDMAARFAASERLWLVLAPEGTRREVAEWKSGFWRIARAAAVPVLPVAFDYSGRSIILGSPLPAGDDLEAHLRVLRGFYAPIRGKRRGVSGL